MQWNGITTYILHSTHYTPAVYEIHVIPRLSETGFSLDREGMLTSISNEPLANIA